MKTIIVTGFMPFGGEDINPAWEAAAALEDNIAGARIVKLRLPVSYARSWAMLKECIDRETPDAVLMLGQAGGRTKITAERYGRNVKDCAAPDCDGELCRGVPVAEGGEAVLESALALRLSPPLGLSENAGGYVCNCLCYNALRGFEGPCAFVHVPYCEENKGVKEGKPFMLLEEIARQIREAVRTVAEAL